MAVIKFFAVTKEYFGDTISIDSEIQSANDLKLKLTSINKNAAELLNTCRFAVNNKFVPDSFDFRQASEILVMPPSSGG